MIFHTIYNDVHSYFVNDIIEDITEVVDKNNEKYINGLNNIERKFNSYKPVINRIINKSYAGTIEEKNNINQRKDELNNYCDSKQQQYINLIQELNEVISNIPSTNIITAKFIGDNTTRIMGNDFENSNIKKLYINDVEHEIVSECLLTLGKEYTVKYVLKNYLKNYSNLFNGCSKMISVDLSQMNHGFCRVTSNMFKGCSGLTSLDLSNWNTSMINDMSGMFHGCYNLTSLDLNKTK